MLVRLPTAKTDRIMRDLILKFLILSAEYFYLHGLNLRFACKLGIQFFQVEILFVRNHKVSVHIR
ncbi:hypothetical protein D3C87_1329020 [compost metagenome]